MNTMARPSSGTAPVQLVAFTLALLLAFLGCSSPSTPTTPTDDSLVPTDVTAPDARDDATPSSDSDADARIDDTSDVAFPCKQGDPCARLGERCEPSSGGQLECTKGIWQNMSYPETGVDAEDASDADSIPPDADAADTLDSTPVDSGTPETIVDSGEPSDISDTSDTSPPDTTDTTPPADTMDTSPDDTGIPDASPTDTGTDSGDATVVTDADSGDVTDTGSPDTEVGETMSDAPDTGPIAFSCSSCKRDEKFDAVKIDSSSIQEAPALKVFAADKIYVGVRVSTKAAVAFWNGTSWAQQDLTPTPSKLSGLDGTSETDLWAAGRDSGQGRLYHRGMEGIWKEDLTEPYAKAFEDIYAPSASDVFLMGWKSTGYKVWRKTSSSWTEMTLPALTGGTYVRFLRIWGLSASSVFVTGFYYDTGSPTKGILLYFNGTSWTDVPVPSGNVVNGMIHGTSLDDLFVTSAKSDGTGVIYRLTGMLTVWTEAATSTIVYGPVWSKYPGTALVAGYQPPSVFNLLRFITVDQVSGPKLTIPDLQGNNPSRIGVEPDGKTVHILCVAGSGSIPAGHYTCTCN